MVVADVGEDGDLAIDDVGGVPSTEQPDLDDGGRYGLVGEPPERGGRQRLEVGRLVLEQRLHGGQVGEYRASSSSEIGTPLREIRSLIDSRSGLVYVPTVRSCAPMSVVTMRATEPLAVRTRDVDRRLLVLRVAQHPAELAHVVELEALHLTGDGDVGARG